MARYVRIQTIRHSIGASGQFELRATSADVRVRATDGDEVTLRATFEFGADSEQDADAVFERIRLVSDAGPHRLSVQEADGPPSLRGMIDRLLRGRGGVDLGIEVEMPRGAEIRLETVSGDVTLEGLHGAQRYTTVSGDLFGTDAGGEIIVNTVSGDVTIRAEGPLALRSDAVSGDLSVVAPQLLRLRTHSVSGDLELEGELSPNGEFRAETVSGDVAVGLVGSAGFEVRGISTDISSEIDHRIEGRQDRRRVVIGDGRPTFLFSSMSGDLSVHRPRRLDSRRASATSAQPGPATKATADATRHGDAEQMAVLQALERGDIDVEEAARRLGGDGRDA